MIEVDQATAWVIHAARACGLSPGKMGSAVQWTMLVRALLNAGWSPPESACLVHGGKHAADGACSLHGATPQPCEWGMT